MQNNKAYISKWNKHKKLLFALFVSISFLLLIFILNIFSSGTGNSMNMDEMAKAPSLNYIFGTDWIGRDVFTRTFMGLQRSLLIGIVSTSLSVIIAIILSFFTTFENKFLDETIGILIDASLGIPHIIFMVLISAALGGGEKGVIIAICTTHWTSLTRILRAEIMSVKTEQFIKVSEKMGLSHFNIYCNHIIKHLSPQIIVKSILLFPHTILHEAGLTFLGFGLSPLKPAIGVILNESANYISVGMWWGVLFPGLSLLLMVLCFENIGGCLRELLDAKSSQH